MMALEIRDTTQPGRRWGLRDAYLTSFANRVVLVVGGVLSPELEVVEILPEHTWGGVVFMETGPARSLHSGEWGLTIGGHVVSWDGAAESFSKYIPLRPIRVE